MSNGTEHRKLAAIMFTDMVGYSAQAHGNEMQARLAVEGVFPLTTGIFD